jgi:hypothetical protein
MFRTNVDAEGSDRLVGLVVEVEFPSSIGLLVCPAALGDRDLILTLERLTIKDKEGCNPVRFPLV